MVREMLVFKKEEASEVARRLGYTFSNDGALMENGKSVKCYSCSCILKEDNLGVIAPGTKIPFCDNPACYPKYLAKKMEKP